MTLGAQSGFGKPGGGKFASAVGHVFSAENAHGEHLLRRQLGFEFRIKIAAGRAAEQITVFFLHPVVDDDFFGLHLRRHPKLQF